MQIFKRIIISSSVFVVLIVGISCIVIIPYLNSEYNNYQDAYARREYAGTIDFIFIGASQGWCTFNPALFDELEGTSSYNLSCSMMNLYARKYMLEKELNRNDIQTVVIEISMDALTKDQHGDYGDGDSITLSRLDCSYERVNYMIENVKYDNYLDIYSRLFKRGLMYWGSIITGNYTSAVVREDKGVERKACNDVSLKGEEIVRDYQKDYMNTEFRKENLSDLDEMIKLCKDRNIDVMLVVVPISDASIWKSKNYNEISIKLSEYAQSKGVCLYDFNLLRNRKDLFSDDISYYDEGHMSYEGGTVFTKEFAIIYERYKEDDDSINLFYDNYNDMMIDMNYLEEY